MRNESYTYSINERRFSMECVNKQTAFKLMCPQDAFMLGNIDQDLYCPYKGFSNYPILAKTPKGQLLGEVMMYDFYVHEMNLYLDTHPCNQEILEKMIMFQDKANIARKNYEQQPEQKQPEKPITDNGQKK